ncbi:glycosyltransferase family 39 protein [Polaribacter sp. R2A056_3_33]|jgi:hypothetical protein|uniref:glycosyltransferase family 39 protein n=1 Tax=Polaribacter sp. R2A056_3_33 TaxID=2745563 RepID=UPI001C4F1FE2|nr:glycosyltransferase family 39 protein [Polaribacter sp. R2A056_3_33]QXP69645.1 glycosyltransferase family 39 protein [Polaribacter sp. R2A056_3_33]
MKSKFKTSLLIERSTRLNFIFISGVFTILGLFFIFGGKATNNVFYIIGIFSLIISNFILQIKKDFLIINAINIVFILFTVFISYQYIDLTFDGQAYHQEIMIQISNGWNPVYESIKMSNSQSLWVNHYPRSYEVLASFFYNITNSITTAKSVNILFCILSFFYSFLFFKEKYKKKKAFIIAFIIACNPVVLIQLTTNLNDGFLYATTIISFFTYVLSKKRKTYLIDFLLSLVLLINVKFTGLIFGVVLCLLFLLQLIFFEKENKIIILKKLLFLSLLISPFLLTPYGKNFIEKGHFFYPLMGKEKVDIATYYIPDVLKEKNRFNKLIYTNFVSIGNRSDSQLKIPFSFTFNELQKMRNGGPRLGSFGVWWGGILISSVLYYLLGILRVRKQFQFSEYEFLIAVIFGLMLLNQAGWWLRYTPYFWLVPLFLFLSIDRYKKQTKGLGLLFVLVAINACLTLVVSLGLRYKDSITLKHKLMELSTSGKEYKVDFGAYLGNKVLFNEYNIIFEVVDVKTLKNPEKFNNELWIEKK